MNFLEAVKAMKEGKKVKRHDADDAFFNVKMKFGQIVFNDNDLVKLGLEDFEATDWQIVEEKKTLSELLTTTNYPVVPSDCIEQINKDVKEANQKFIDKLSFGMSEACITTMKYDAKEIFGGRLIK